MEIVKIKGWVARDKSNDLYLFNYKPHRTDGIFYPCGCDSVYNLPNNIFPELSWKNGAVEVELTIKLS